MIVVEIREVAAINEGKTVFMKPSRINFFFHGF